jgi:hypothetical protein
MGPTNGNYMAACFIRLAAALMASAGTAIPNINNLIVYGASPRYCLPHEYSIRNMNSQKQLRFAVIRG